ncbi:Asp/Glu/hydantoin racemase, partial [Mesorhizobium sp. M2C.T.Ca.TU.009.01.2.1]
MKILVVNVNTSQSMSDVIDAAAKTAASPGTDIVTLTPF